MSHQHRKLSEAIRAAHYLKRTLEIEAAKSEYSRGLYNGFELIKAILEQRDPKLIDKLTKPKTKENKE